MAEFVEVMAQKMRMCRTINNCNLCRIRGTLTEDVLCFASNECSIEDIERAEHVIMEWAKENPKPLYPTWAEWLTAMALLYRDNDGYFHNTTALVTEPIPTDIAEKLNIQPKGT